jgi:hypothetical protein
MSRTLFIRDSVFSIRDIERPHEVLRLYPYELSQLVTSEYLRNFIKILGVACIFRELLPSAERRSRNREHVIVQLPNDGEAEFEAYEMFNFSVTIDGYTWLMNESFSDFLQYHTKTTSGCCDHNWLKEGF